MTLYSVLVMLGVSLILGITIAIFAKVFEVNVDPRIQEIIEILPSINCGTCGYPGCSQYAEALVEKGAVRTLCTPGGAEAIKNIERILKHHSSVK